MSRNAQLVLQPLPAAAGVRDLGEAATAAIPVEEVRSDVRDIQVDQPVVVDVSRARAHAVAAAGMPDGRHILIRSVAAIAEQAMARAATAWARARETSTTTASSTCNHQRRPEHPLPQCRPRAVRRSTRTPAGRPARLEHELRVPRHRPRRRARSLRHQLRGPPSALETSSAASRSAAHPRLLPPADLSAAAERALPEQPARARSKTSAAGRHRAYRGNGLGVAVSDVDDDGWPDVFVANDSTPNFLFHNAERTFTRSRAGRRGGGVGRKPRPAWEPRSAISPGPAAPAWSSRITRPRCTACF